MEKKYQPCYNGLYVNRDVAKRRDLWVNKSASQVRSFHSF